MKQTLSLRHHQQLILTTAMRQALHVLSLPLLELQHWLLEQIEANPLLALEEEHSLSYLQEEPAEKKSLYRHLMDQVPLHFNSQEEKEIAQWIIGNLDERGFFQRSESLSSFFLQVLEKIQTFDPPGIAAKDLKESLLIQLTLQGKEKERLYLLIRDHFDAILKGAHPEWRSFLRKEIGSLNFYLPSAFSSSAVRPIKPDLFIRQSSGEWYIEVKSDQLPEFHFVQDYLDLLDDQKLPQEERAFIRSQVAAGKWLIRSLYHRERLLVQIGEYLTKEQPQCFIGRAPRPLTLQQAAEALQIHPSTMTRAIQGKYCLCEEGIIPLRSFFSRQLQPETSTEEAKVLLKKLISQENPSFPLPDNALAKKMHALGIPCARRTVAKYRHALCIPNAKQRRE